MPEAFLRSYHDRKRPMALWSAALALFFGAALLGWSPVAALAVLAGTACGLVNAFVSMRANEGLAAPHGTLVFVISSIVRLVLFGIILAAFGTNAPVWSMLFFLGGFFTPLTLYGFIVSRAFRTE
jgi:hypothetical protein